MLRRTKPLVSGMAGTYMAVMLQCSKTMSHSGHRKALRERETSEDGT
jgi:hypothetical protein